MHSIGLWYRGLFQQDEWKNKYKNKDPKQGEAFFGSTTFLVFLTDKFHFVSFLIMNGIMILLFFMNILYGIAWRIGVWIGFHITYK